MTNEQEKQLNELCELIKETFYLLCTCGSDPEGPCRYCSKITKAEKLFQKLTGL